MKQTRIDHAGRATALGCVAALAGSVACGSGSAAPAGFEGGPCIQGACGSGLVCAEDVCVPDGDGGSGGTGVDADSTTPNETGTSGPPSTTTLPDADTTAGLGDTSSGPAESDGPSPCEPPTDAQLCTEAAVECGALEVIDRCGDVRRLDCGACSGTDLCERGTCVADPCAIDYAFCGEGCCPTVQVLELGLELENSAELRMRESSDGSLHMCFKVTAIGPDTWYASSVDGVDWELEVVDVVAPSGQQCFVYAEPGQPTYITAMAPPNTWVLYERAGSPWAIHEPPLAWTSVYSLVGTPSIGIDLLGQTIPIIDQLNSFRLARFDDGTFTSLMIEPYGEFSELLLEPGGLLGSLVRLDTDLHAYRTWDGAAWSDDVLPESPPGLIWDGELDDEGEPHFIFSTNPITWVHRSGGQWLVEEAPGVSPVGVRMAVGPGEAPFVYFDDGTPSIAHREGGVWHVDPLAADHSLSEGDIVLGPNGLPVVCGDLSDQVACLRFE